VTDPTQDPGEGSARPDAPSLEESLKQFGQAGRDGFGAAVDTGRALRSLLAADFALARASIARACAWLAVAVTFGASSWLLLMGAFIALLQRLGLSWLSAMAVASLVSVVITGLAIWQVLRYFEYTRLDATRRQLRKLGIGGDDEDGEEQPAPSSTSSAVAPTGQPERAP
jgi:hypothetical protein